MSLRLLLTGASGFLGAHLGPLAASRFDLYSAYYSNPGRVTAGTPVALDLKDEATVRRTLAGIRPDVIIHTATSNRDAQNEDAIVPGARVLARFASAAGAQLIHLSTDLVFDGEHPPYTDDSPLAAIGTYGKQKAAAEALVRDVCPMAAIVRPSLIYGSDPLDLQTTWLVEGMQRGETVRLFTDEIRCPVWVHNLCAALLELVTLRPCGPISLAGPQPLARWDFGMKLLAALGLAPGPNVVPSTVKESSLDRARNLTLVSARAAHLLQSQLRPVDNVLSVKHNT